MTKRPWTRFYGDIPPSPAYPRKSLHEAVMFTTARQPAAPAIDFFGHTLDLSPTERRQ